MIIILLANFYALLSFCGAQYSDLGNSTERVDDCPYDFQVQHGTVNVEGAVIEIVCNEFYDLEGSSILYCKQLLHDNFPKPRCVKRCYPPSYVDKAFRKISGKIDKNGTYRKGTVVEYACHDGYMLSPPESRIRVCEQGLWTGIFPKCLPYKKECDAPKELPNGYFVLERTDTIESSSYFVGQRIHYSCKEGYVLNGSPVQLCLEDGHWSPKIPPNCTYQTDPPDDDQLCRNSPEVPYTTKRLLSGYEYKDFSLPETVVEYRCLPQYRDLIRPCEPTKLRCLGGRWIGRPPSCVVVPECLKPPVVAFASIYNLNSPSYSSKFILRYPPNTKITYQCLPGYVLQGNDIMTCSAGGCWTPPEPPTCLRVGRNYYLDLNGINTVLISLATGAGVLSILIMICLVVICRCKKNPTRTVSIPPPMGRAGGLGDHATLLNHPDRLALIAFADGYQNSGLPVYDEVVRDRAPGLTVSRLQRPHWPNLAIRRSRNSPNPDVVHVARHGSLASHTPSTRSAIDSMGSTDTVAASEGSTNVTLDTASSHSGSQAPSCRVHCGSLASFDASSVNANNEGIPLIEENELEDVHCGDTISLVLENPSLSDGASHKLSTTSTEMS